ncbi:glutamine-hydrolyzing carbamoyl-phosphate synthase small subunit [bacterium]|nr:glutamine-hydrolyzing carbamoyl-phosphate synthase small subunit [bacterium]NIN92748.1 glutamine-hydrolyzing carbamoyl-phosphate synthase small subunit [bacterium]NIO18729.1 glutamine-hydrolyzing carbamoyl-phosphate synthase small subunit [bacterium]NIO73805.1 glutamine-hydrolyzing carbamoyl-phosphate synthase small subunit [bacterium]
MTGVLVLEDGTYFEGISIGKAGERIGEVVLNTAVVGYQEIMTDPANAGKILVFTYPLIGNYGVARKFSESRKCWIEALVIREESKTYSNWQAEETFNNFLNKERLVAVSEVDTRTLAVRVRDYGEMLGIVSTAVPLAGKERKIGDLVKRVKDYKKHMKRNFITNISREITEIKSNNSGPKIAIIDLGMSNSFVKQLKTLGCNLTLLPYNTDQEKILGLNPDGLIISNGPEEDEAISGIVEVVKKLIGKIPILGISLGHEIMALALGGRLKRLKIGHRGVNYPVKSSSSHKGDITVQNHSFVVDEESIKGRDDIKITLRNVNDDSIEEMESGPLKFISTQYYPVSPGFDEINVVFKRFLELMK